MALRKAYILILSACAFGCGGANTPTAPSTPTASLSMTLTKGDATLTEVSIDAITPIRTGVYYVGCGDYSVVGTITYTVSAELMAEDGTVYANVPPGQAKTQTGGAIAGCSANLSGILDESFAHPVASRIRFIVTYRNAFVPNQPAATVRVETDITPRTGPLPQRLVIEQFRPFGPNGATDQFIELFNDSISPATVPEQVGVAGNNIFVGTPIGVQTPGIGPLCHYLIAGPGYSGRTRPDVSIRIGLENDGSLAVGPVGFTRFVRGDQVSMNSIYGRAEGTPLPPFDATAADRAYIRHGPDTGNNAADFVMISPSNPRNSSSCEPRASVASVRTWFAR